MTRKLMAMHRDSRHFVYHGPRRLHDLKLTDSPSKCTPTRALATSRGSHRLLFAAHVLRNGLWKAHLTKCLSPKSIVPELAVNMCPRAERTCERTALGPCDHAAFRCEICSVGFSIECMHELRSFPPLLLIEQQGGFCRCKKTVRHTNAQISTKRRAR